MTKLFILNATAQNYTVFFRVPEIVPIQQAELTPGEQQCVFEGDTPAIAHIIKQLETYGILDRAEYNRSLSNANRSRTHLLYAIDRPFSFTDQEDIMKQRAVSQDANAIDELKTETASMPELQRRQTNGKTSTKSTVEISAKPVQVKEGDASLARSAEDIVKLEVTKD
ncbi:hypothetical protein [Burkholderia gladioli]|uniref:hypothetical protein n=1 Tax=Burkholderia gladioli TaxID=28095 RepID=UPI003D20E8E7